MALAALIGAYDECDDGRLRALVPLAGRPLVDYQARCCAALGAAPIVLVVDQPPAALVQLAERLRSEGLPVILAEGAGEAASRFEGDAQVLLLSDGIAPETGDLAALVEAGVPAALSLPDDERHEKFERIDLANRWGGAALVAGGEVGATAAMLGDWDLPSTLLRRAIQKNAALVPSDERDGRGPLVVASAADGAEFSRRLMAASKARREDWVARGPMAPLEDWMVLKLAGTGVRPRLLGAVSPLLTLAGAASFGLSWWWAGLALLLFSMPFDLVAQRVASLRMKPLPPGLIEQWLSWPFFLLALLALGGSLALSEGWGAAVLGGGAAAIAELGRGLRKAMGAPRFDLFTFRRRPAIVLLMPFAAFGAWLTGLGVVAVYALVSALWVQHGVRNPPQG
ncbi:hypothetical protein [Sphingomicrobium nitratireducens]|uniref:hypothetical protein n=1 Tax=Sphingomicrobium nitratireducens TaxID=2964666 RepID=UPI00223F868F|nr:hypothetical protein [Sphingomicrobium nitratireducens]